MPCYLCLPGYSQPPPSIPPSIPPAAHPPAPAPSSGPRYVAVYDYVAADEDEISFQEGGFVCVINIGNTD